MIQARRVYEGVVADPRRFRPVAAELVHRARQTGPPEALVLALRALAWAVRATLADDEARRLLDEAARIARRHSLDHALADVLMNRAAVNQELGRLGAAQRDLDTARSVVAPARAVELAFQQAVLHQNIGRLTAAATTYRGLLARRDTPMRTKVIAANNLSMIEAQHGEYADALRRLDEAGRRAKDVGPALVAMVAETRAWVTVQSGRLAEGLRLFHDAARAHEAAGLPLGEHYVEYSDALMDLRLIPEAIVAARSAAEVFRINGVPLMGAEAELRVAQLAMLAGNLAEARSAATAAEESFDRQGRRAWKARAALVKADAQLQAGIVSAGALRETRRACRTLTSEGIWAAAVEARFSVGRIAASLGRISEAVDSLQDAANLAAGSPVLVRLRGKVAAATAARLLRRDAEIVAHCRHGLNDLARHRRALPSMELRALASGHGTELGQLGLEVVVRDGNPRRVFEWMERTRAAALLAIEPADASHIEDDLQELRAVHAELQGFTQHPDRGSAPPSLLTKQMAIETRIRRATWRNGGARQHAVATANSFPLRDLLAGRVLVEYGMLGDQVIAVVIQPRRSRVVELGPIGAVLEQVRPLFFALRRMAQARPESSLAAARLSADLRLNYLKKLLLRPLRLPSDVELVIVPVGQLHGIPWSSLHDGPVSLAPSARFWARTQDAVRHHSRDSSVILVEGPRLAEAVNEVRRLRRLYPNAIVLSPSASTARTVLRLVDGADLVHLACHGWLRSDNPLFSSLVLSDGPLTVQELVTRRVAPHRLILASCQSGADVSYAGDEVLGFVSAMLARGTAGIVASVAAVPDVAAADLMYALHQQLVTGRTLAHALYGARTTLDRDDPATFVNWCTFSAHGAA